MMRFKSDFCATFAPGYVGAGGLVLVTALAAACSGDVGDDAAGGTAAPPGSIDPLTGLPIASPGPVATDPLTGEPLPPGATPSAGGTPTSGGTAATPTPAMVPTGTPSGLPPDTPPPGMAVGENGCITGVPGTTQIPRLSNAQYNRTVYDLLGLNPPGLLAIEQAGEITTALWGGYQASADAIAAQVIADPELKANFMRCTPSGDGAECLSQTIVEFGRRAYRRPLTEEEVADYELLVSLRNEVTPTGAVDEVAELLLSTFLKAPTFLMRSEVSDNTAGAGPFALSSYEVAARLSYMLWGTTPDDVLSAAADANQLQTKADVLAQAARMVADDKARDVAAEFHREYLHLFGGSRWDATRKDSTLFPAFTDQVVPDMIGEMEMLFDGVFASAGSFQDLLVTNTGYVTAATAPLYGLDPADFGETPTPYEFPAGERPGFLTRVGFLSAYSAQTRTSPILRGAFITKDVLGIDPGMPDPAAAMAELPSGPDLDTNRKRVEAQTAGDPCSTCHTPFINPPGFVLEGFDSTGAAQANERETGAAIDTSAEVFFSRESGAELVNGPAEMMTKLAASPSAQRFYAQRWVGFAYDRELTPQDLCTVDMVAAGAVAPDYSIQDLLVDLTQSDYFLTRAHDEVTQ